MTIADYLGAIFAFGLTLAVLSYLLGDNPVYRVAIHIFVGAAAGYAALIVSYNILYPQLIAPVVSIVLLGQSPPLDTLILNLIIPAVLAIFLLMKAAPSTRLLGGLATAFMIGVGVAVAVGGAVTGTILPQTGATFLSVIPENLSGEALEKAFNSAVIIGGTLVTLGFFYYGARAKPGGVVERSVFVKPVAFLGQIFIGITFGVMYAGALATSLALFADRLLVLWSTIELLIKG